jgi:hypothetical protein
MNYLVYDPNGKIIAVVGCSASEIESTAEQIKGAGYCQLDKPFTEDTYFDGTKIVKMPVKPTIHHVFDYTIKDWVDPRTVESQWAIVRAERDKKLQATDWTQLGDVPASTKQLWEPYRQALRDLTKQVDPFNIVYPALPG